MEKIRKETNSEERESKGREEDGGKEWRVGTRKRLWE